MFAISSKLNGREVFLSMYFQDGDCRFNGLADRAYLFQTESEARGVMLTRRLPAKGVYGDTNRELTENMEIKNVSIRTR